jgi:DNA repair exonuclease SbcCD ATPase subunit
MLVFKSVKYQNFLAAGNAPIEIDLSAHPTTLIVGKNGTGKSTMAEAICFAAFGRPLRNISKPKLINSINQHDCLVELTFVAQNTTYLIRRGIKPNVFEIYADGTLIPSPASVADYQTILEQQILKLNYKSFMQVVVLGSASYVPFMRLNSSTRREIIEDILDIEVFSSMNALAREDGQEVKSETEKAQQAQHLVTEQVKMAQQFTDHMNDHRKQAMANLSITLTQTTAALQKATSEKQQVELSLEGADEVQAAFDVAHTKADDYDRTLTAIETRERKIRKERQFYAEHDTCPTCEQQIDSTFKQERDASLLVKETEAAGAIIKCKALVQKYQARIGHYQERLDGYHDIKKKMSYLEAQFPLLEKRIREIEHEIAAHKSPQVHAEVDLQKLDRQLEDIQAKYEKLMKQKVIIDAASVLLRDNGIKTRIIRHYLPIINRTINHYLNAMDFPVLFTLDEEFVEHLKSRYRDDFAYDSFSEGEKKRIDLALLLTWRAVAALKNSAATNLLILDEVFDSSLDVAGTDEFMKIIAGLEKETNVFVISHKTDQLIDKFSHVVTFEKSRGFSQIKV